MSRWIRNRPERRHDVRSAITAIGIGAAVGAAAFYVMRICLAREPLPEAAWTSDGGGERERAPGREG